MKSIFQIGVVLIAIANIALAGPIAKPLVKGKYFDRFVVIVLENTNYDTALNDPYMASLGNRDNGVLLTNYMAVAHPSQTGANLLTLSNVFLDARFLQPNYVAMIKGNTRGVFLDFDSTLSDRTIVDLLEPQGISWKSYAENYPGGCKLDKVLENGLYVRKHVPFISFTPITSNPTRCANIVPASQLDTDIANNAVLQFVFYTPNMNNDGHNTNIDTASEWLKKFLEPKLKQPAFFDNTLILVTFDEQEDYISLHNHVFAALIGGAVKRTIREDSTAYNHYSVLATVERNWNLGNLGEKDVDATPFATTNN
ncbi:phosphoesterase family-domain-containing protein [Jimgerdemannia flammicorona]|uniref:Phosphoesterase family-domain-containing protein n=1 Tax=Jimgerdemannia flammicorona TaxID=994334 RepID=A0A433D4I6_9FUNG|nr:phosphoesterase family-domain-containing protein [Jimgerdemannia flammicorona]